MATLVLLLLSPWLTCSKTLSCALKVPVDETKSRFSRSQVIQSVAMTMMTMAEMIRDPNQNTTIRTEVCSRQNFLQIGPMFIMASNTIYNFVYYILQYH